MIWWQRPPIVLEHGGIKVVRDDLVEGGTKIRFLPHVVKDAKEIVYGGPCCGGAAYALSVWGKYTGAKITLFYADRKKLHWKQRLAQINGAQIVPVQAGRINVVQHRARTYAADKGALFLPLGFDTAEGATAAHDVMRSVSREHSSIAEVWCATGSGMLARCLGYSFPNAKVYGVTVGLASRHADQVFPNNVQLLPCVYEFDERCKVKVPFPCDMNYEAKAWERMMQHRKLHKSARGETLFWNVAGNNPANDTE